LHPGSFAAAIRLPLTSLQFAAMPRILITASFPADLLQRQTPRESGQWEDFEFVFEPDGQAVDGWVVYDDLRQPLKQLCPPQNTLLITGEPASVRRYRPRFTGQFAHVWTAQSDLIHGSLTRQHEAQHWHYAMRPSQSHNDALSLDTLAALRCPAKTKLLSVICSDKQLTPDQRQRVRFTEFLQHKLGDVLDVYGRGRKPVSDKADAIWPYKYHIVLENDHCDYFMTEKISDAFLGWSYPLYYGGSEAGHRFPSGSFTALDIYQPQQALETIRQVLSRSTFESAWPALSEARRRVLQEHNLFAMLVEFWRNKLSLSPARRISLLPKSHRASLVARQLSRRLLCSA
jgi:hypothetical protein